MLGPLPPRAAACRARRKASSRAARSARSCSARAAAAPRPPTAPLLHSSDARRRTAAVAPLAELEEVTRRHDGILYIDDAHGTGVVGERGRGAASVALPSLRGVLQVGSLSKGFSCLGAYVTCYPELKRILKIRSSTFIFGGPVPPPAFAVEAR